MPLKAFFFLVRNPGCAEVEAFRSLIFNEQEQRNQGTNSNSGATKNNDQDKKQTRERI